MTPTAIRALADELAERLQRGANEVARVAAALDDAMSPAATRTDTGRPGNRADWCPTHERVIDARCRSMLCDGAPSDAPRDPTGDAVGRIEASHRRTIESSLRSIRTEVDRLADTCAKVPPLLRRTPSRSEQRSAEVNAARTGETDWCAAHLLIGATEPASDHYRNPRLCNWCGRHQPLLAVTPGAGRGVGPAMKLARHMTTTDRTTVRDSDLEAAFDLKAGEGAKAMAAHGSKRPPGAAKSARGWHTSADYADTSGMIEQEEAS